MKTTKDWIYPIRVPQELAKLIKQETHDLKEAGVKTSYLKVIINRLKASYES